LTKGQTSSSGTGKPKGLEKGYYVKPTVLADVNNQMEIARTEFLVQYYLYAF
jgi:acyl-CoA reductase-like NAD-dependent aldehyde dehydrogenase